MKREEFFEAWIKALESGEYKQGKGALANRRDGNFDFCCLGVACMVDGRSAVRINGLAFLPEKLSEKLDIDYRGCFISNVKHRGKIYLNLAQMNDAGVSFKTIAKVIRDQLKSGNFRSHDGT